LNEGRPISNTLETILALPYDWHGAGTVTNRVLRTIAAHSPQPLLHTAETGTGRTTLLLSNTSRDHVVFAVNDAGSGDSLARVRTSALLSGETTRFVVGPTQLTLPRHEFADRLDLVLIDGPHAFPFPCLEYYYFAPHVRPGGLLIVDDINIPSIKFMFEFLRKDAMWRANAVVDHTAFLTRTGAPALDPLGDGWWLQGYNRLPRTEALMSWAKSRAPSTLKSAWRALRRDDDR
jgi:predicted O-methyltransferase YrrM